MRSFRFTSSMAIALVAACAGTVVRQYGDYTTLAPRVSVPQNQKDQRRPTKVAVQLAKPANVAVFLVTPGRTPTLLFPADSTQSTSLDAGTHELTTAFAKPATVAKFDSSRAMPRPPEGREPTRGGIGQRSPRDSAMASRMDSRYGLTSYIMVYASEEPLSYKALSTRVQGLTIPAEEHEALNTVAKLIRGTQQGTGPWAAWATDF